VRDFVKYDDQPYSLAAVPESLLRAYRIATTEPKGPVYVGLDSDLQEQPISSPLMVPPARLYRAPAVPAPNPEALREAAELLVEAEWPVIVAGEVGRTPHALAPLRELAEILAAPVVDADGHFAFPNTHPLDLTAVREQTLRAADVVLALDVPSLGIPLGPSVREREALQLAVRPGTKIVHITLLEFDRQSFVNDTMWLLPVAVPMAADTSIALPQLLELCRHQFGSQRAATQRIEARRARAAAMHAEARRHSQAWIEQNWHQKPISSARLYGELNARLKGQSWALVHAHGRRWREVLEVTEAEHGIGGGRGAGVGYGLPASIGAALGYKGSDRLCVSVLGDGDFLMTSNALWTAARYGIPLLILVFNNRSYYNDEEHQERMAVRRERPVENKGIGVDLKDPAPDLAALARALSVEGFGPILEPDQLGPTLDRAIEIVQGGRPAIVDVVTQPR
jgi:acetolactate synthase I/II/III large subunit